MKQALRVTMACLGVGLAVAAFRLARVAAPPSGLAALFWICCAARLQNDWRDRVHDIKKGKTFAAAHPRLCLLAALTSWGVCCLLVAAVALRSATLALALAGLTIAGAVYSETRTVPWLPICLAAAASAAPAFLPAALAGGTARLMPLFGAAALLIFARELVKDIEDQECDVAYKWTIPLAYGTRLARWLAIASVGAGCVVVLTISPLVIGGVVLAAAGAARFGRNASPAATMNWLDGGAGMVLATLAAFPP